MSSVTRRTGALVAALVAALAVLAGCGGDGGGGGQPQAAPCTPSASSAQAPAGGGDGAGQQPAAPANGGTTIVVSAAASLNKVYPQIADQFKAANPDTDVKFNFGGSDTLAQQIVQGAPADVLATASTATMQTAAQAGKIQGQPVTYATNTLQIATAPNNPKGVCSIADMARPDIISVTCLPTVPCGVAATAAEKAANVALQPKSQEQDVTGVLNRVRTGNADAGLVYVTDVKSANGQVQGYDFPQQNAQGVKQTYPIAVVAGSQHADAAQKWVSFVTGPQGKDALRNAGFVVTP